MAKHARCSNKKCRKFIPIERSMGVECPNCTFCAYRCPTAMCGGIAGARRSLSAHHNWYRTRGGGMGGHNALIKFFVDKVMRRMYGTVSDITKGRR